MPTSIPCAMWCPQCGTRFTQEEIKGWGCPKCSNTGIPCSPDKDIFVEVNWHELHILCCWAEFWANQISEKAEDDDKATKNSPTIVHTIAKRLQLQWPELYPLTLSDEIAELPEALEKAGISVTIAGTNIQSAAPFSTFGPGAVGFSKRK